jgi:hypothetical protein
MAIGQVVRAERTFLVLCIAVPQAGAATLASIDVDELLTSEAYRRVARHLVGRVDAPLSDLPEDDEELARVMADLVDRAGRTPDVSAERVEHARLVLARDRLDRAIRRARAEGRPEMTSLARQREQVLEAIRGVVAKLEKAV